MKAYTKVLILAALGVSCLTLNTGAQQPQVIENDRRLPAPAILPVPRATAQPGVFAPATPGVFAPATEYPAVVREYIPGGNLGYAIFTRDDGEILNLTKQLSEAKADGDKEKIKEKLKELLVKQFDDRQKRHEKELEALEAQVKKLKEMVGKRQDNKKDIVEERMKQLQRDALGLGW